MNRKTKRVGLALLGTFLAIQLWPVSRANPPVESEMPAPPEVRAILRRACYDCHSNETRWPWYAYVAPVSWMVVQDVDEGRAQLNFSRWNAYSETEQLSHYGEILDQIDEGHMPMPKYVRMHHDAQLSAAEIETLRSWSEAQ
jgi:hypothetical protein